MKRKLSAALLLLFMLAPTLGLCSGYMKIARCNEWVSLRERPSSSAQRLAKIPLNEIVANCTEAENGFTWCEYKGLSGYVKTRYLKTTSHTPSWTDEDVIEPIVPSYSVPTGETVYGIANNKLATRKGPGTHYKDGGTYSVAGDTLKILARSYDNRNDLWWVLVQIPYHGEIRELWTGSHRFGSFSPSFEAIPIVK